MLEAKKMKSLIKLVDDIRESLFVSIDMGTWHGYIHMVVCPSILGKILWSLCIICSTSFCMYMGVLNFLGYLEFPVTTTSRYINEKESIFPSVAICNANQFITNSSVEFLLRIIEEHVNIKYEDTFNLTKKDFINNHFNHNKQLIRYARYTAQNNLSETELKRMGLQLDELIIKCEFDSENCNLVEDFEWKYSWDLGNCFVFNNKNQKQIKSTGINTGLSLELFSGFEQFFPLSTKAVGFDLMIQNESSNFKFNYYFERTSVEPGVEVNIAISRKFYDKSIQPYSECEIDLDTATIDTWDSKYYKRFFERNEPYDQLLCFREVYHERVYENCGCILNKSDAPNASNYCYTPTELDCEDYIYKNEFLKRFNGNYDSMCPLSCDTSQLTLFSSSMKFPSTHYAEYLLKNNSNYQNSEFNRPLLRQDVENSVSKVNIYYDHLGYDFILETPTISLIGLLASTGGLLGKKIQIILILKDTSNFKTILLKDQI